MFVDEVNMKLYAGNGGDGCTSFRREKFVPMGGPDGGNGGKGADIIFEGDKSLKTLVDLKYHKIVKAPKGTNGKGSNKYGANAEDVIIKVPLGTSLVDNDTGLVIGDILNDGEKVIAAKGGRGGRGNKSFATHDNTAPNFSEKGEPGEIRYLKCELKLIADVGLIGMPSVGKSTILSMISNNHPKIAAYHFTTLNPNIGVIKLKDNYSYTVADLPGLIEGASEGIGLGDKFLKHAMRTKVIAHVVDMGAEEGRDPIEDYKIINNEVEKYSKKLLNKEKIVIATKMDLPDAKENLDKFKKAYPDTEIIPISAINMEGLDKLVERLGDIVKNKEKEDLYSEDEVEDKVVYKFKEEKPYTIQREDGMWKIGGPKVEKLFKMTKFDTEESAMRFARKLKNLGIDDGLKEAGAKPGDDVEILGFIFEYKE